MQRTARNSILALALTSALALLNLPGAQAASASSHADEAWTHSPATTFDWSQDHFDLNTQSRYGRLSLSQQVSLLFLAINSAWVHSGGDAAALNELWTSSWQRIEDHDEEDHRSRAKFFSGDRWHRGFDEWTHRHHPTDVCLPPDDPQGPTVPEPIFYSAMMGTGVGAVALLRGWRRRGRSLRLPGTV